MLMDDFTTLGLLLVMALATAVAVFLIYRSRRNARSKPIRVPDSVSLYERNAFQMLGLIPVQATTRRIMSRRDELQVVLDADLSLRDEVPDYRPVGWPWAVPVTADELKRAVGKLQNEPSRFEEEVCWFHLDGEDAPVLAALAGGDLAKAREAWQSRVGNGCSPYRAGQAAHNLAVLSHADVLQAERIRAQGGVLDAEHLASWRNVLEQWGAVHANDSGWNYFDLRRRDTRDPRVNDDFCRHLRSTLPARVLRINLELARAAIAQDNYGYASGHLDLMRSAPFPEEAKASLVAEAFEPYAHEVRAVLQPLVAAKPKLAAGVDIAGLTKQVRKIRAELRTFGGESALAPVSTEIIRSVQKPLVEELRASIGAVYETDLDLWKMNNRLIGLWNKSTNRFELKAVCEALGQNKSKFSGLETKLSEADQKARRAKMALDLLRELCVPDTEALHKGITEDLEFATSCTSKARAEIGKTREHFDRNYNNMRQQAGV